MEDSSDHVAERDGSIGPRHSVSRSTDPITKENEMHSHDQVTEHKSFSKPEEVRKFANGKAEILNVGLMI